MKLDGTANALEVELENALDLLEDYRSNEDQEGSEQLPSLLDQCQKLYFELDALETIRVIHSFACTGGTLFSKLIAALPNVMLLSELDPLSKIGVSRDGKSQPRFSPTDIIYALNISLRQVDDAALVEIFRATIRSTVSELKHRGLSTVIREHAHSHFCTDRDPADRPGLRDMLLDDFDVRSVVTVRHPLDSFLSLRENDWCHFEPATLEEYSRRYIAFLDCNKDSLLLRYEDLIKHPETTLEQMCGHMSLPFTPLALDLMSTVFLTGDSGRTGDIIAARPRRDIPDDIETERASQAYIALCQRLEYDPGSLTSNKAIHHGPRCIAVRRTVVPT